MAMEPPFNSNSLPPLPPGAVLKEEPNAMEMDMPLPKGAIELPAGAKFTEEGGDSSLFNNFMTAAGSSFTSESPTASAANILESWIPAGRIGAINPATGKRELWQSTASALGKTEEEWSQMTPEQRRVVTSKESTRRAEASADEDSVAYGVGRILGMFDPTVAIPFVGGASVAGRVGYGAAVGAADMAMYSASQEGQVDPAQVAMGAGIGGAIPLAAPYAGKLAKKGYEDVKTIVDKAGNLSKGRATRKADKMLDEIQMDLATARQTSENSMEAFLKLGDKWSDDQLTFAIENSKKGFDPMRRKKSATEYLKNASYEKKSEARKFVGAAVNPLSRRFKKISPKLAFALRNMDRKALQWTRQYDKEVKAFTDAVGKIEKTGSKEARAFTKALLNRNEKEIMRIVKEKGLEDAYSRYRAAQEKLFQRKVQAGLLKATDKLDNYTPRWVKDYRLLKQKLGQEHKDVIQKLIKAREQKEGRELVEEEINDVYNKYLQGYYHKNPKIVRELKTALPRRIKEIDDNLLDAYSTASASIHSDIRSTMDTISRRELFGKAIVNEHGDNLTDGINAFVKEHGKDLSRMELEELRNLLTLRFVEGSKKPWQITQNTKNLAYMSMLGNPISALTQFGDLAFSIYRYNVVNTAKGLMTAKKLGLTPKEMGLMETMAEEFVSSSRTKTALDTFFRKSGFKKIDKLGKQAIINGALRKFSKQSMSEVGRKKLAQKWKPVLGDKEFEELVKDFQTMNKNYRKDNITDRMKAVAFSELADIQPITLLEMPEMYLKFPNGRIVYMLKTFALKHLDFMRQEFLDDLGKLETLKSPAKLSKAMAKAAYLSTVFTAMNMSSDAAKNFILGKDNDVADLALDNALKNIPLYGDKYLMDRMASSRDPVSRMAGQASAPWSFFDPAGRAAIGAAQAMSEGDIEGVGDAVVDSGSLRYIPGIGRMLDAWIRDN